jgi:hypothetical protein
MAIISKLKEADLLDLRELFNQSNEDSKKGDIEFVRLPDGVYVVLVKKFEFKTLENVIKATWTFEVDESEGEFANVLQYKSAKLDSKEAMTRFLKDVRKFDVDFNNLDELLETLNDQIVGTPCLIKLEAQTDNPDRQWLNIIVEDEGTE